MVGGVVGGGLPPDSFPASVPTANQLSFDATTIGTSALLALLFLLLAAFPGQLFNKTYEEHEEEIGRWFARGGKLGARVRGAIGRFWNMRFGVLTFVVLSAILYGFLSPSFGVNGQSLASLAGILVGLFIVILTFELPLWLTHRRVFRERGKVRVIPMTIMVGVLCVIASRVTSFQPGYLYGLVVGYVFSNHLELRDEARAHAWTAVWMLVVSLAAWLLLPFVDQNVNTQQLLDIGVSAALATIFVAGLEGILFELVPLRFLRGQVVFAWRKSVWAVLFGSAAFLFAYIMLEPNVGYLGSTRVSPLLPAVILFAVFGLASVAFWGYFRFRREREEAPAEMA